LQSTSSAEKHYSTVEWNKHSLGKIDTWPQSFKTALNIILNNPSAAILLWSKDFYTFPNEKFLENYLTNTSGEKITGVSAGQAIPEFWGHIREEVKNLFVDGNAFEKTVYLDKVEHPDASYYSMLSVNATPVHLEDDSIGGVFVICMDVKPNYVMANELKERIKEQEFIQKITKHQENATSVESLLSEFAAMIPPAMQFPNIAEASVEFDGRTYKSDQFDDCKSTVFTVTQTTSKSDLVIHVAYTQETSHATKNSIFVQKEKKLVETLAGQAALFIEKYYAQQDAQKARSEINQLLETIPGGFLALNKDWTITLFNQNAEELLNKKRDNVIGKNFWSVFPGVRSLKLLKAYKKAVQESKPFTEKEYFGLFNKWFEISIKPSKNSISVYFDDISEEFIEQKKLDDLSTILQEIHSGVVVTNQENRIDWVNETFVKITGFTQKEAVGKTPEQLLCGPETDLEVVQQMAEDIGQQRSFAGEFLSYTKSGKEIWLKLHVSPVLDDDGKLKESVIILEDISQQKQVDGLLQKFQNMAKIGGWDYEMSGNKWFRGSERFSYPDDNFVRVFDSILDIEERNSRESQYNLSCKLLDTFLEETDIAIWAVDENNSFLLMNRNAREVFGISQDGTGKTISEVLDENTAAHLSRYIDKVNSSSASESFEELVESKTGDQVYLTNIYPLSTLPELENAVIAASVNITDLKGKEDDLKESLKKKETLLAEIHHRVKNNLAVVSGLMQLQAFNSSNTEITDLLNASVNRIRSIAGIHEQLYQSENFSDIDLSKSLKRLVNELISTMVTSTKIHQEIHLDSVLMTMQHATSLSLIVNEVITNILKHAFVGREEGNITINLSDKKDHILLEIKDDGVGLPDDFDVEESDSIGMELIHILSEQLQGKTSYQSYAEGTRFTLTLPKSGLASV
jgi:PAS domain S-box-containing protein